MRRIFVLFLTLPCFCTVQGQKNYSLSTSIHFDFGTKGLSTNDAGIGLGVHSNFFSKKKLQVRTEAAVDHFIGNKLLYIDNLGNHYNGNPTMISLKAGPEIFIFKNISVAGLYGVVGYKWFADKMRSDVLKLLITAYPEKLKRSLFSFYYSPIPQHRTKVHFFGVSLGYTVL